MRMQSGFFTARHRSTNRLEHLPFMPFGQRITEQGLSNNIISALALDGAGRLWVGTFRDGIDVLNAEGRKVAHLESDVVREINYLLFNPEAHSMLVATSQGAMQFDARLGASRSITAADGLLSNSVTHLAQLAPPPTLERKASAPLQIPIGHTTAKGSLGSPLPSSSNAALLFATSRGFSFADRGRVRGLTTVQGLPSNNTYAVLARGSSVFVGTLGGLAQVEGGKVARVWTTSNSNLPHNWVNGLCLAGSRLFVGTYGGGVCELQASGDLHCFASEVGRTFVNPNAMWADDERLYVGTLDGAFVYELRSGLWRRLHEQLPAATVLAITGDEHYTYFGTTNGIARIDRDSWRRIPLTKR